MTRVLWLGALLTVVVAVIEWLVWGRQAVLPAITFGAVATVIQAAAVRKLRPAMCGPLRELIRGWAVGAGLRLAGIVLLVVAIVADRNLFPPLPTAVAYLAVVVPLLFGEIQLSK